MIEINKIYLGDCLEIMKQIPDKSIDLICTDPPYGVNYEGGYGIKNIKREKLKNDDEVKIYKHIFKEFYRILKDKGSVYCFYPASKEREIFPYLWETNFVHRNTLIWNKSNIKYASLNTRYHHCFEPILYLNKPNQTTIWNGGTKEKDIWTMMRNPQNIFHPTQKTIDVMMRMIKNSSNEGDIVLDPFCGSGTTCLASKYLKRNYIGIEINEKYVNICNQRLKQNTLI